MQLTPAVKRTLSWYESDKPGTKGKLAMLSRIIDICQTAANKA